MAAQTYPSSLGESEHVVQFYDHECELVQSVGLYLAEAMKAGSVAIVIATEAHRRAFAAEAAAAGADLVEAARDGSIIWRDAASSLAAFMPQGAVDGDAFMRQIGTVVRNAAATGRPVRAFGEMVSLLWERGDVLGAIELERLWNELQAGLEFSLLCAYRSASVAGDEHAQALQQVCQLHSAVAHAPRSQADVLTAGSAETEVCAEFPQSVDGPRAARRFVADALAAWGLDGALLEDAQVVVSELASNAIIHAHSPFSVAVCRGRSAIRLSVHDAAPTPPKVVPADPGAPSGRGLRVVAALAREWGIDATSDGKTVWAELRR